MLEILCLLLHNKLRYIFSPCYHGWLRAAHLMASFQVVWSFYCCLPLHHLSPSPSTPTPTSQYTVTRSMACLFLISSSWFEFLSSWEMPHMQPSHHLSPSASPSSPAFVITQVSPPHNITLCTQVSGSLPLCMSDKSLVVGMESNYSTSSIHV